MIIICVISFLFVFSAKAQVPRLPSSPSEVVEVTPEEAKRVSPSPTEVPKLQIKKNSNDPISRSWIPIAGYNSTYSVFGGGGFFFNRYELNFGSYGVITLNGTLKLETTIRNRLSTFWNYSIKEEIGHGFEPLYGEGSRTRVEDRVDLTMWKSATLINFNYEITPYMTVGPVLDFRWRRSPALPPRAPVDVNRREDAVGIGIFEQVDLRDIPDNPTFGWYQSFAALAVPSVFPSDQAPVFGSFDFDLRFFQKVSTDLILAIQLALGTNLGEPTYLFTPRLGGTNRLRGYLENRFRGPTYYIEQTELRFPIWRMISGVTFLEFGEVGRGPFGEPNASTGVGLRVGLPPDYLTQVRLDVGFGKDQMGVFLDFGHSF